MVSIPTHELTKYLRMARAAAAQRYPYFSEAYFAAKFILTPAVPSIAAIDAGYRVYWNPELVWQLLNSVDIKVAISNLAFILSHEIYHNIRDHHGRSPLVNSLSTMNAASKVGNMDMAHYESLAHVRTAWNLACDMEINQDLDNRFAPTTVRPVYHYEFGFEADHLAEVYFRLLMDSQCKTKWKSKYRSFWSGSGVHGQACDWELPADWTVAPAVSKQEQMRIRHRIATEAANHSRGFGSAGWLRVIEIAKPRTDWRKLLRSRIRKTVDDSSYGNGLYTYKRPSRRSESQEPFFRPSVRGRSRATVYIVLDTSGSMSAEMLAQCLGEIQRIIATLHCRAIFIPCDAVAYEHSILKTANDVTTAASNSVIGGGGTSMAGGIERAIKLMQDQTAGSSARDLVLVLTDGYTEFPEPYQAAEVVWGILQPVHGHAAPAPHCPPWRATDIVSITMEDSPFCF